MFYLAKVPTFLNRLNKLEILAFASGSEKNSLKLGVQALYLYM